MDEAQLEHVITKIVAAMQHEGAAEKERHREHHSFVQLLIEEKAEKIRRRKQIRDQVTGTVLGAIAVGFVMWVSGVLGKLGRLVWGD